MGNDYNNGDYNHNDYNNDQNVVTRVDERTKAIQKDLSQLRDDIKIISLNFSSQLKDVESRFGNQILDGRKDIQDLQLIMERDYTKKSESGPVHKLVYGFVVLVISTVLIAVVATVVKSPQNQPNFPIETNGSHR